ncbi:MAG: CBS domain-containing protein [Pseudomonadota bacterium]
MKIKDRPEYDSKPKPVTFLRDDLVSDAIEVMSNGNFGSVVIMEKDNSIAGIVTERDLMRRLLFHKKNPEKTPLSEIMTAEVRVAKEDDNLIDWLRIMSNERFRHLPVVDEDGKLVNMMSQGDFVSYTWPELFSRIKENTAATFGSTYQIILIIFGILLYSLAIVFFT